MNIQGTYTALVTPFKSDQEVDYELLKRHVEFQVENGVEGLVPCGTTGESPTLDHKEHLDVIAKTIKWAKSKNDDIIVIAGTGSNSTKEAIELTRSAHDDGADCALLVNPYYNKPNQEGLYSHFMAIADSVELPVLLYNIPGRTSVSLTIETIVKLSAHPNIIGVKEATGDIGFMAQVIEKTPDDFILMSGDDNILLPVLSIGGKGVISVISNIYPHSTGEIVRKYIAGDISGARDLFYRMLPVMRGMFIDTNPIPVKGAMFLLNMIQNVLRLPMTPLSDQKLDQLKVILDKVEGLR